MFFILICTILVVVTMYKLQEINLYWTKKNVQFIPPWPFLGNMSSLVFLKTDLFTLVQKYYESFNGRYYGVYQFLRPVLHIKDIELIKQICIKDFDHFVDHKSFFNETNESVFHKNLFGAKGQEWKELRALLSPTFTGSKMRAMYTLINDCAKRFTNYFETNEKRKLFHVDVQDVYRRYTIDMIGTCVLGIESNSLTDQTNEFFMIGREIGSFSGIRAVKTFGFMFIPKVMRFFRIRLYPQYQINFFSDLVTKTIDYREKNKIIRPDLIHLLMEARKGRLQYEESGKMDDAGFATVAESEIGKKSIGNLKIDDDLIVAQALVFFIGGSDSTANVICFMAYELAVNMDIQEKLQNEIDTTFNEYKGNIPYETLMTMKYLDMVICETLRKWPQAFVIDRLCTKDYKLQSDDPRTETISIEKGSVIAIPVIGIHKDPKYFENPEKFNPERFSDENKSKINPYAFLPFGLGPRSCIGNRFALLIVKSLFVNFLHKFSIVTTKETPIPMKLSKSQIIIDAANGFNLAFKKRND